MRTKLINVKALESLLWGRECAESWRTLALTGRLTVFTVGRNSYVNRDELLWTTTPPAARMAA